MTIDFSRNNEVVLKLTVLKQERFSGRLILRSVSQEWVVYLYLGRILYATGGIHPVRRWRRNLTVHCPEIALEQLKLPDNASIEVLNICWEYQFFCSWLEQRQTSREQVLSLVQAIVSEVLFDVIQAIQVTFEVKQESPLAAQLVLLDAEQVVVEVQKFWQSWQTAKIADRSPNQAPVIKQPEQLQQQTSASVYQALTALLDGQRTLRDLAVQMKRTDLEVSCSLLPYIQAGLVDLIEIADLPAPIPTTRLQGSPTPAASQRYLVACVDDSPLVCQTMEKILTTAGYQFLAVQDSLRAIATLLTRKPDLIFLDLVMPNTNGYEICTQLRKVSTFRDTPIIILTGNDGIIDRVRAKVVGSTGFLSKPVNAETVLEVARSHLHNKSLVM